MKKIFLLITLLAVCAASKAQIHSERNFISLWTIKQKNINTNGLSLGIIELSGYDSDTIIIQPKKVNGVRLELVGPGLLLPLIPHSPISDSLNLNLEKGGGNEKAPVTVNGINLSGSGSVSDYQINGVSAGFIGQYIYKSNGLSLSGLMSIAEFLNGVQLSAFNDTYKANGVQVGLGNSATSFNGIQFSVIGNAANRGRGIQLGLFNKAKNFKGIQLGLWNINQKRKMPIVNWNFKN